MKTRRKKRAHQPLKPTLLLKAGVFAVGAALLGWLIVRTAAVEAYGRKAPAVSASVAPAHPEPQLGLAMQEFRKNRGEVSPASLDRAYDALGSYPIADEPFLLAAVTELAEGNRPRGYRLLEEVRRRNPRSRIAHLLLLDRDLRVGRVESAVDQITVLLRLFPRSGEVLIPELAKMAVQPATQASLREVLKSRRGLQNDVLSQLVKNGERATVILTFADNTDSASNANLTWRGLLVDRLVSEGKATEAYRLWRRFMRMPPTDEVKVVHNDDFRTVPSGYPFDWRFSANETGTAEIAPERFLQVEYYGRQDTTLAKQILILTPGRYQLKLAAKGNAPAEGSSIRAVVTCESGSQAIVDTPLKVVGETLRQIAIDFVVPEAGCSHQSLVIAGRSGEFPKHQSLSLHRVQIEEATRL